MAENKLEEVATMDTSEIKMYSSRSTRETSALISQRVRRSENLAAVAFSKNKWLTVAPAQLIFEAEHQLTTDKEPNRIPTLNSKKKKTPRLQKKCSQTGLK